MLTTCHGRRTYKILNSLTGRSIFLCARVIDRNGARVYSITPQNLQAALIAARSLRLTALHESHLQPLLYAW